MKCKIEFNMDNAAFIDNANEVSNILQHLSERIKTADLENGDLVKISDSNGIGIGYMTITPSGE